MVGADVVASVVSLCGVLDDARVPDVRGTQPLDFAQGLTREVGHFTAAVFGQAAAVDAVVIVVSEESGEHLVDDEFVVDVVHGFLCYYCWVVDRVFIFLPSSRGSRFPPAGGQWSPVSFRSRA